MLVGLACLMGASGLVPCLGALVLASRRELRGLGRWITWAAAGFGASLIAFSTSRSFWLSTALLIPAGFTMIVQTAASNTLIQAMVPDALRGRVMATLFDDVHGYGPLRCLASGTARRSAGRARGGRSRWSGLHCGGGRIRIEAPCACGLPADNC